MAQPNFSHSPTSTSLTDHSRWGPHVCALIGSATAVDKITSLCGLHRNMRENDSAKYWASCGAANFSPPLYTCGGGNRVGELCHIEQQRQQGMTAFPHLRMRNYKQKKTSASALLAHARHSLTPSKTTTSPTHRPTLALHFIHSLTRFCAKADKSSTGATASPASRG